MDKPVYVVLDATNENKPTEDLSNFYGVALSLHGAIDIIEENYPVDSHRCHGGGAYYVTVEGQEMFKIEEVIPAR